MKFKVKRPSWERRNLWESNTFGYFGHTTCYIIVPMLLGPQETE
jgi:hypothetical protein